MKQKRLVFITSLERSGSTLLDLTLGRHPQLVSFGEVARVLLPHDGDGMAGVVDRPCSCGAVVRECAFWGPLTEQIGREEKTLSLAGRYALFLAHFESVYSADFIPVDSSKFVAALDALHELIPGGLDLRVLFTVRDVRGWISSCRRADKRQQEIPYRTLLSRQIGKRWKPYLRHNVLRHVPFWTPLEWYLRNRTTERYLGRKQLATKRLSYERLTLNTEQTLAELYSFIGVEKQATGTGGISHVVRGNRMAFDPERNSVIHYDAQWQSELWPQYEAMAWPFVMRKNVQWVYEG